MATATASSSGGPASAIALYAPDAISAGHPTPPRPAGWGDTNPVFSRSSRCQLNLSPFVLDVHDDRVDVQLELRRSGATSYSQQRHTTFVEMVRDRFGGCGRVD